jgi:hypothetical protein
VAKEAGHRITAGEDRDTADHVANLRAINVTPHVTQHDGIGKTGKRRRSAIDERTTRYRESLKTSRAAIPQHHDFFNGVPPPCPAARQVDRTGSA